MKDSRGKRRKLAAAALIVLLSVLTGCEEEQRTAAVQSEPVHLIWYQIGAEQPDGDLVEAQVNAYTREKSALRWKSGRSTSTTTIPG